MSRSLRYANVCMCWKQLELAECFVLASWSSIFVFQKSKKQQISWLRTAEQCLRTIWKQRKILRQKRPSCVELFVLNVDYHISSDRFRPKPVSDFLLSYNILFFPLSLFYLFTFLFFYSLTARPWAERGSRFTRGLLFFFFCRWPDADLRSAKLWVT